MIEDALEALLNQEIINQLAMLLPLLLQLLGLIFAVLVDSYISRKYKRIMLIIAFLVISLVAQNYLENLLTAGEPMRFLRTLVAIYGYVVRPIILVLFLYIVSPNRKYGFVWILIGVNAAIYLTALFSGICFYISENNHYQRGALGDFCFYISIALLGYLLYLTLREYRKVRKREICIPIFNVLLIVWALIMDGSVGVK